MQKRSQSEKSIKADTAVSQITLDVWRHQ